MATMNVEILTPEAALWTGTASALMARSSEGEFTVLPEHTATVGDVVPYVVRVQTTDEGEIAFAVHSGFFQVGKGLEPDTTLATVLASVAERTTEIDVPRAQAAKEAAEARLASAKGENDNEELLAYAALQRAELRLSAASK
jgi:F-type H+-transporting ATPase subunit epsilon